MRKDRIVYKETGSVTCLGYVYPWISALIRMVTSIKLWQHIVGGYEMWDWYLFYL